ncbi:hypothetical protein BAE44_0022450 [Dichanthelium oligosanthes]|uniref:Uncharacterized protein n=1 Tax=Dichanthelium oligosanthes TaxID=888268 RepID=A0A1E5UUC6_9POAL|nr:hypothetical protein BAE44_0022450 [Dichanthelium oligosanthes]
MSSEDGMLGFATMVDSNLYLCSSVVGPNGDVVWAQSRFIELKTLLPIGAYARSLDVVGFADGVDLRYRSIVWPCKEIIQGD